MNVVDFIKEKECLLVGQRWDYDEKELIDFDKLSLQDYYNSVKERIKLHPPSGSDYFMFKKGSIPFIPPFLIGRVCWDNWMIYNFLSKKKCLDATKVITVIHQNHDYNHVVSTILTKENKYNENIYNNFVKYRHRYTLENILFSINKNLKLSINFCYFIGLLKFVKHYVFLKIKSFLRINK